MIQTLEQLEQAINNIKIRLNVFPRKHTRQDFVTLNSVLDDAFTFLYTNTLELVNTVDNIITSVVDELHAVAFSGSFNDLEDKPNHFVNGQEVVDFYDSIIPLVTSQEIADADSTDTVRWSTFKIKEAVEYWGPRVPTTTFHSALSGLDNDDHTQYFNEERGDARYIQEETDPVFSSSEAASITSDDKNNWNNAYSWGDHSSEGYLTSFTETDPIFTSSDVYGVTSVDISNWNTAYSWGDHSSAGYLTSLPSHNHNDIYYTETEINGLLDGKADLVDGIIPQSQLPSYVDHVLEYTNVASFPTTGESGKIYIDLEYSKTYRWAGSIYAEVGTGGVSLGETSATAYRGDRGKIAYDHSQLTSGNPHDVSKSDVELGNVDNTSDVNKPISSATQSALNNKVSLTGNESISGIKTFSSSPIVPTATANSHVVNKEYADSKLDSSSNLDASNIVGIISDDNLPKASSTVFGTAKMSLSNTTLTITTTS